MVGFLKLRYNELSLHFIAVYCWIAQTVSQQNMIIRWYAKSIGYMHYSSKYIRIKFKATAHEPYMRKYLLICRWIFKDFTFASYIFLSCTFVPKNPIVFISSVNLNIFFIYHMKKLSSCKRHIHKYKDIFIMLQCERTFIKRQYYYRIQNLNKIDIHWPSWKEMFEKWYLWNVTYN